MSTFASMSWDGLYWPEQGRRARERRWAQAGDWRATRRGQRAAPSEADRQVRESRRLASAILGGDHRAVLALLAEGASATQCAPGREAPLLLAARAFDEETAAIAVGAEPTGEGRGERAERRALRDQVAPIIPALLRAGASPEVVDASGLTPLMIAASLGASHALSQLLDANANTRTRDASGSSAIDHARARLLGLGGEGRRWARPSIEAQRASARRCEQLLAEALGRQERDELAQLVAGVATKATRAPEALGSIAASREPETTAESESMAPQSLAGRQRSRL